MSWDGRNFPQLGRKLLDPHPARAAASWIPMTACWGDSLQRRHTGLNTTTYAQMIQNAFYEKYWDSFGQTIVINGTAYNQMEANFSLFWGLSVMLYESTLVSDQTPFDLGTMTAIQQQDGLLGI